ncbi:thiol:disulfide interchange protein DsbA/DsbL [Lysobacter sp. A3-1-A15]|uniref:thiol:disulfide interchange protein DsbA/DsbL n=1 Tax=Novilysobacter viscosus TaxID=3098602 RepID=UPI002ED89178
MPMTARLAALLLALLMTLPAAARDAAPLVPGVDYVEIPDGQPFEDDGAIEVVEVFGYTCPHCAAFEPRLRAWKARLPADVRVTPVAAPFGGHWMPYARAYFAARTMGVATRTHAAMFRALHEERALPLGGATASDISAFYAGQGVDAERFEAAMASDAVQADLQRADAFLRRAGVDGTPALVVQGRYRVLGNSFQELLDNADALVARERAARARAGLAD